MPETCKTCRFYADDGQCPDGRDGNLIDIGTCRIRAPQMIRGAVVGEHCEFSTVFWGVFPQVKPDCHCGEHQPIPAEPQNATSTGDIRYA